MTRAKVARCGTPCQLAARCLRTTPGRAEYQTYNDFPGGDDCHGFKLGRDA